MSKYDKIYKYNLEENSPLIEGETELWSGKPKRSAYVINQILAMMPIALIWLSFDLGIIIAIFKSGEVNEMLPFIIPFFAFHLFPVWIWLGNVFSASKKWKNTKYYVTDKRIVIQYGFIAENYQTIYYKDINNVYMRRGIFDKLFKVGDIYFDLDRSTKGNLTVFFDIENPTEIYSKVQKIILDIQTDIEYPNALRPADNPGYNTKYKR